MTRKYAINLINANLPHFIRLRLTPNDTVWCSPPIIYGKQLLILETYRKVGVKDFFGDS